MREETSLLHDKVFVGRLWNPATRKGNFDASRSPIDRIIIHTMEGTMSGTTSWFSNPSVNQSAHYGVGLDGKIRNFIPESATAYHSGSYPMNQRSIGIEHEDGYNPQTNSQAAYSKRPDALYEASARLVCDIAKTYSIPLDRKHVFKHNEVVDRTCPGSLDVDRILARARELYSPVSATRMIEVDPEVFKKIVTKSSEYDEVWKYLVLPQELRENVGSSRLVIDTIISRITEARAMSITSNTPLPQDTLSIVEPIKQSNSVWKKDISEMLSSILGILKKDK